MKTRTFVSDRLYYGLDPMRIRAATSRALARVVGLPPARARVSATNLRQDFALDTVQGTALVDAFVAGGLLDPPDGLRGGYGLTPGFAGLAQARVVYPLPRARARLLLTEACALAQSINATRTHNPLEIAAFAVFGDYMSRDHHLASLDLGVLVRLRLAARRTRFRRMQSKGEGAEAIRAAFQDLSTFVRPRLVTVMSSLPRPFSIVFQPDDEV